MDRRSWPWKKRSSEKAAAEKAAVEKTIAASESAGASLTSAGSQDPQENYKKPTYVQISVESYTHLTGLEDQVKTYGEQVKTLEDQINELNEKLTEANSEMITKENLVKQHAKVAEEAVSGWEKAESEASALKNHLESVTLLKLTAEDRASHLDGALKECMRQIRNLKEEHEHKLQEVVITKTKQWDIIKLEFEGRIVDLDQELRRSAAENAALSRSLQERSNMLIKISEEKSQADVEIELLKNNIESCEREINSLKYEHHIISKELEIRNEEKNMSMRSAEVANKQHMEGVKKIAKLEAECQRLRGLVRKKLPGPAALAQMKLEVESLGRDYGETRLKRSPVKPPSPHLSPMPEFSLDNVQKFHKENEFLTERLLAMEEETKMLKEALAKRNSELQASRNVCAMTASKLQSLEAQLQMNGRQKSPPHCNVPSQNASSPPSLASMSEDGIDDDRSCAESWATTLISELPHVKKNKNSDQSKKAENANRMELMDDFLEMEKLACLSNDSKGATTPDISNNKTSEIVDPDSLEVTAGKDLQSEKQHDMDALGNNLSSNESLAVNPGSDKDQLPLMKLRSRISTVVESMSDITDMGKILEDIKLIVQDAHDNLHQKSVSEESNSPDALSDRQVCPEDAGVIAGNEITISQGSVGTIEIVQDISTDLAAAISQIHDFILFLGKEAIAVHDISPDGHGLGQKIESFSVTFNKVLDSKASLTDFVVDLSYVLSNASELRFNVLGYKSSEAGFNTPDCIDKVALPENKTVQKDTSIERYQNGRSHISDPTSALEIPDDGISVSGYEPNTACKLSLEEFEQLKSEKDNLITDLARCTENLETTKSQLQEIELLFAEAKSQLAYAQKSNSLAETQLKCMAESYRSLEKHAEELESEVNLLQVKTDTLENELQEEKRSNQDALARCEDLQDQLQRHESCSAESNQERDLAAAAEKLAECQETIFLLGKQLKGFRPQTEFMVSPYSERSQRGDEFVENEPTTTRRSMNLQDFDASEMDSAASPNVLRQGAESPLDMYNSPCSPSETEANLLRSPISSQNTKHRHSQSSPTSSSSTPTPEKHSRGISRFFSSKGKNGH